MKSMSFSNVSSVNFQQIFSGWRIKLHNLWGAFKVHMRQSWRGFLSQMGDTNKALKSMFFMFYTLGIIKALVIFIVMLDAVWHEAVSETPNLIAVPQVFTDRLIATIQEVLTGYEPIYQVGICLLVIALFVTLLRPVADLTNFAIQTAYSSNLNWKAKIKAVYDETAHLFDVYYDRLMCYCTEIIRVAIATFVVYIVWNLLSK